MYDHAAILADFEAWLLEDGRQSHGTAHLTAKLAELRARHRIDEDAAAATLRRFGAALLDDFIGRLPADEDTATDDPLVVNDPGTRDKGPATSAAMDGGAATDHTTEGDTCPPKHPKQPLPPPPVSSRPPARRPGSPTRRSAPAIA